MEDRNIEDLCNSSVVVWLGLLLALTCQSWAQHEHHQQEEVRKPRVYLDKSPRIVEYQLRRLSNAQLLLVDRAPDDAKYRPVHREILLRAGIAPDQREDALGGLRALNGTTLLEEVLDACAELDLADRNQNLVFRQLSRILLHISADSLNEQRPALLEAVADGKPSARVLGFAGLIRSGAAERAWEVATADEAARLAFLNAIGLLPSAEMRSELRPQVVGSLDSRHSPGVRRAAIRTLSRLPAYSAANFLEIAPLVEVDELRPAAVRALLRLPKQGWSAAEVSPLLRGIVERIESMSAADRTASEELDGLQLAEDLLSLVSAADARVLRERLRKVTVRLVQIGTVHEEMRYDKAFFAVEAGRPVQIVLRNHDAMPHNLVVTVPGALRDVALQAGGMGTEAGPSGKQYVPDSEQVLFATKMVQPDQLTRLVFNAPAVPGEYPFVCTFPRHWMRMYGVMVVVDDLEAWLADPEEPADPLGNTRQLVKTWTPGDLPEVDRGMRGRNSEIGARLFEEATCAQCHKLEGVGGAVGPDLTEVSQR